ncbi:MAG: hypothetical protein RIQ89_1042 [Bacteroidota bacterium]
MKLNMNYSQVLAFTLLLLVGLSTMAQPPGRGFDDKGPGREKIESMKIGFISAEVGLSPEEAKVFWPVYNKYQEELETVRKSRKQMMVKAFSDFEGMGDKEIETMIYNDLAARQNEIDIAKKYHPEFKKILTIKKVALLYKAEEDWKRRLLKLLQERRPHGGKVE